MLYYIIDGYNLINALPFYKNKPLQFRREKIIEIIRKNRLTGSPKNRVMIVFDGKAESLDVKEVSGFKIVFTHNITADDFIVEFVGNFKNPKVVRVITDDKELRRRVKSLRAEVIKVSEFLAPLFKCKYEKTVDKFTLSYKQMKEINEELKKIWLE